MLSRTEFLILVMLGAVGLVLAVMNILMFTQNGHMQAEVSARAQYIQQAAQVEPLYREIVKALADLTIRNNDTELRDLLAKQGITVSVNQAQGLPTGPSDVAAPGPKKATK
jgi:hypothetical protein